jgi:uncharacterized membrane protein
LLSGYTITDVGQITQSFPFSPAVFGLRGGINNAPNVQVVGEAANGHAYVWDSVHGMQDLGTVGTDSQSQAFRINDSGQVVGYSDTETMHCDKYGDCYYVYKSNSAFLWDDVHGMKNLGNNGVSGINAAGEVSGTTQNAAIWSGSWTQIGSLGGSSGGGAINDYGQVAGSSSLSSKSSTSDAFLWTPSTPDGKSGTMVDLGISGNPLAINGQGAVVGRSVYFAFLWSPSAPNSVTGHLVDLPSIDGISTVAYGINDSGVIVGDATAGAGGMHAVVWQPDATGNYTTSDLNALIPAGTGWDLQGADGINKRGQIVVEATRDGGLTYHALLLTPAVTAASTTVATAAPALAQPATVLVASPADAGLMPAVAAGSLFDVAVEQLMAGPQHRKHPEPL